MASIFYRNDVNDEKLKKDPKYKKYVLAIDRALMMFDNVQEWADYISFLGKLLKALQAHTLPIIPRAFLVSNRLSQCIHPNLPSGVHQKALDVYDSIFDILGPENLANDLDVWLPGILPLMNYASINVKSHLILIYRKHIIFLRRESLRTSTRGLLLALLPAIDDETSESFDSSFQLIVDFMNHINDDSFFWSCFFSIVITSSERKLGALALASKKLPSLNTPKTIGDKEKTLASLSDEQKALLTPEPGLLIRAICCGLSDSHPLVQRGFLDLLLRSLVLNSGAIQDIISIEDLTMLLKQATNVLLRKDMSLNRRLWTWLLGPEPSHESPDRLNNSNYFKTYALSPLINALKSIIDSRSTDPIERAKPFKICLSLLDRWEIGCLVVPQLFLDLIKSLQDYKQTSTSEANYSDVLRSARVFFDAVESASIWGVCFNTIRKDTSNASIILFIFKSFNLNDEEMQIIHIPLIFLTLLVLAEQNKAKIDTVWLDVCNLIIDLTPGRAFISPAYSDKSECNGENILDAISVFYAQQNVETGSQPFSPATISWYILTLLSSLVKKALAERQNQLESLSQLLSNFLDKIPGIEKWHCDDVTEILSSISDSDTINFKIVRGSAILLRVLIQYDSLDYPQVQKCLWIVIKHYWRFLSMPSGFYNSQIVSDIWALHSKLKNREIEAILSTLIIKANKDDLNCAQAFVNMWNTSIELGNYHEILSRPLYLILDALEEDSTNLNIVARNFLSTVSISDSSSRLFNIIIKPILSFDFLKTKNKVLSENDDIELLVYYIKTLSNIFKVLSTEVVASLESDMAVIDKVEEDDSWTSFRVTDSLTYKNVLLLICLDTIMTLPANLDSPELVSRYELLVCSSLNFLTALLQRFNKFSANLETLIKQNLTAKLFQAVVNQNERIQVILLRVLSLYLEIHQKEANLVSKWPQDIPEILALKNKIFDLRKDSSDSMQNSLVLCITGGFSKARSQALINSWTSFLAKVIKFFNDSIFQIIIPIEDALCNLISTSFISLKHMVENNTESEFSEISITTLISGLEKILVIAHKQLRKEENAVTQSKNAGEQSFIGTVISGVFSVESPMAKNSVANDRFTVLLCFQDAIKTCNEIWNWTEELTRTGINIEEDSNSLSYKPLRLKYRTRKLLEQIYLAEPLEVLECLVALKTSYTFRLLHILDGSMPKRTAPYIFDSIYSRVSTLDSQNDVKKSSLTTDLTVVQLVDFLKGYILSLENDAIEDIWDSVIGFTREVANNISVYRPVVLKTLYIIAIVSDKVDSTLFGEQKKIKKDLSDTFFRLLNSVTSARVVTDVSDTVLTSELTPDSTERSDSETLSVEKVTDNSEKVTLDDLCTTLVEVIPLIGKGLNEQDKILTVSTTIVQNVLGPTLKAKTFPTNVRCLIVDVLISLALQPYTSKAWRGYVLEAISSDKFFSIPKPLISKWNRVFYELFEFDREPISGILSKLSVHNSNTNVLFGWSDTEKSTKFNLRRLAYILSVAEFDKFVINLKEIQEQLISLLQGTISQSVYPEIFTCLRAIILSISDVHLYPFWTLTYSSLQMILSKLLHGIDDRSLLPSPETVLAASKLLDVVLLIAPEQFQEYEWLFINDTTEALFRGSGNTIFALAEKVAAEIGRLNEHAGVPSDLSLRTDSPGVPLLNDVKSITNTFSLQPFFTHLSINHYEHVYSLTTVKKQDLRSGILIDIFD